MLSFDPAGTRAILVGTSKYPREPDLDDIPAVTNNLIDLRDLLIDKDLVGVPEPQVTVLADPVEAREVLECVHTGGSSAYDTLFIYYAGHGLLGSHSPQLLLGVQNSTLDTADFNSVAFESFRQAIANSSALKKVLIIDSCFSGRAIPTLSTTAALLSEGIKIRGTFTLASAPATLPALAAKGARNTTFTASLLNCLQQGRTQFGPYMSLQDIYAAVRADLAKQPGVPLPQQANNQSIATFLLAKNRSFVGGEKPSFSSIAGLGPDPAELEVVIKPQRDEIRGAIDNSQAESKSRRGMLLVIRKLGLITAILRYTDPDAYVVRIIEQKRLEHESLKQKVAFLIADERKLKAQAEQEDRLAAEWERRVELAKQQQRQDGMIEAAGQRAKEARAKATKIGEAWKQMWAEVEHARNVVSLLYSRIEDARLVRQQVNAVLLARRVRGELGNGQIDETSRSRLVEAADRLTGLQTGT